jgi:hypothetical protein
MKRCTDELRSLDVRQIHRARQLRPGAGEVFLAGNTVRLEWTLCRFGGHRPWWLCPVAGCGRRVALLYAGRALACRTCSGLAYRSQRETTPDRAIRRADDLRKLLGWKPGIAHPSGEKPKGMQWRTFWRLRERHDEAVRNAITGWASWLDSQRRR